MKHVFSDVDGCILDGRGRLNVEEISLIEIIRMCEQEGITFGLNSNRGYSDLAMIKERLNFDGPMIIENGSAIIHKNRTIELSPRISFEEGEPANVKHLKDGKIKTQGIYYDQERGYSLSIYLVGFGSDTLTKAENMCEALKRRYPDHQTWYKSNGHIWCVSKCTDKGKAIKHFSKLFEGKIAMIGHDNQDMPALEAADFSAAPSNRERGLTVDYVSEHPFTKGTIDCILNSKLYLTRDSE